MMPSLKDLQLFPMAPGIPMGGSSDTDTVRESWPILTAESMSEISMTVRNMAWGLCDIPTAEYSPVNIRKDSELVLGQCPIRTVKKLQANFWMGNIWDLKNRNIGSERLSKAQEFLFGDTAINIIRKSPIPVIVVTTEENADPN